MDDMGFGGWLLITVGMLLVVPPVGVVWLLFWICVAIWAACSVMNASLQAWIYKATVKPYTPEQLAKLAEVHLLEETRRIIEEAALALESDT